MNSFLDLTIAFVILGSLLAISMNVDSNVREHVITTTQDLNVQENAHVMTNIIEYDFRKIGHGLINPFAAITVADSSHIIFSYDRNPSSVYDSTRVEYLLTAATRTPNPNDKILIRRVNGAENGGGALGVSRFRLRYYNQYGALLPTPVVSDSLSKIREIALLLVTSRTSGFRGKFGGLRYSTRFTCKNLLVRYGNAGASQ
ncbi:MAG: hypothetical protein GXO75_04890 [Calditrichaeota bacterium]|nr:hypothetical protein [Calditrichota bacterium]